MELLLNGVTQFNPDQKADRLFILLGGDVAVYKLRDDSSIKAELEFYKLAVENIAKQLTDQMESYGYISTQRIIDCLDDREKSLLGDVDHINGSKRST